MKNLLTALAVTLATLASTAHAKDIEASEMLSVLIANSSRLVAVNEDGKPSGQLIAEILGQALAVDTGGEVGSEVTVNSVTGGCETSDVGKFGEGFYDCGIQINNGDYKITATGLEGPLLESSTILRFKAKKNINGKGKLQLESRKVTVSVAG